MTGSIQDTCLKVAVRRLVPHRRDVITDHALQPAKAIHSENRQFADIRAVEIAHIVMDGIVLCTDH